MDGPTIPVKDPNRSIMANNVPAKAGLKSMCTVPTPALKKPDMAIAKITRQVMNWRWQPDNVTPKKLTACPNKPGSRIILHAHYYEHNFNTLPSVRVNLLHAF